MSILVDKNTRVIVQGITGKEGSFHTAQMVAYGTQVVGGVTPGKAGQIACGVPVFDSVSDAVKATHADASVVFVPPRFAKNAVIEAVNAGIQLLVLITEGIPSHDMVEIHEIIADKKITLVGPNCPGLVTVGGAKLGIIPGMIFSPGRIGVVARSGTLAYEVVYALSQSGLGQTTCVGIGGDPMPGTRFIDVLPKFNDDPETDAVVMIGEIGGTDEEAAAEYIKKMSKPVVAFISGKAAPEGKRMGHAGAIISGNLGTYDSKAKALTAAGVAIADQTGQVPALIKAALGI